MDDDLKDRYLKDGIYQVHADTLVEELKDDNSNPYPTADHPEIQAFAAKYPNYRIASAYETFSILLLSEEPSRWRGRHLGSGFNYGSTNFLDDAPSRLLILAEND